MIYLKKHSQISPIIATEEQRPETLYLFKQYLLQY